MIFHGLRIHRKANHAYLSVPFRYGGMDIETFVVSTNFHRWEIILDHLERDNLMQQLFWESLGYSQLVVGSGIQLLSLPYKGYTHLVKQCWIKKL